MRGASAIEDLLKQFPSRKFKVFVVWEPILLTDWQRPTSPVLSRVSDLRAAQFWDRDHLVSKVVREHIPLGQPNCCDKDGYLWDLVALYPENSTLNGTPIFIAGPVVRAVNGAEKRLSEKVSSGTN